MQKKFVDDFEVVDPFEVYCSYVADIVRTGACLLGAPCTTAYRAAALFHNYAAIARAEKFSGTGDSDSTATQGGGDGAAARAIDDPRPLIEYASVGELLDATVLDDTAICTAAACVVIACKLEVPAVRLRTIITVFARLNRRRKMPPPAVGGGGRPQPAPIVVGFEEYERLKQGIVDAEERVLFALGFRTAVELPHKFVLVFATALEESGVVPPSASATASPPPPPGQDPPSASADSQATGGAGSSSNNAFGAIVEGALVRCNDVMRRFDVITRVEAPSIAVEAFLAALLAETETATGGRIDGIDSGAVQKALLTFGAARSEVCANALRRMASLVNLESGTRAVRRLAAEEKNRKQRLEAEKVAASTAARVASAGSASANGAPSSLKPKPTVETVTSSTSILIGSGGDEKKKLVVTETGSAGGGNLLDISTFADIRDIHRKRGRDEKDDKKKRKKERRRSRSRSASLFSSSSSASRRRSRSRRKEKKKKKEKKEKDRHRHSSRKKDKKHRH